MVTIKVDGDSCLITRRGTVRDISDEYLKVILSVIESLAIDTDVSRKDLLTYLYDRISDIYNDDETTVKTV